MPKNYHNHSVNVNKVLYVTMSCAVSMYAMLAAYGHQPVRDFDLLVSIKPTGDRKETKRPDPVPEKIMKRLRLLPVHCARSVVVVDSQSIIIVFYHTPCCLFCLT